MNIHALVSFRIIYILLSLDLSCPPYPPSKESAFPALDSQIPEREGKERDWRAFRAQSFRRPYARGGGAAQRRILSGLCGSGPGSASAAVSSIPGEHLFWIWLRLCVASERGRRNPKTPNLSLLSFLALF